jgi:hypothetical protein
MQDTFHAFGKSTHDHTSGGEREREREREREGMVLHIRGGAGGGEVKR